MMTISTTLQWKISKTKKRLSKGDWYLPCAVIISTSLFVILSFMLRSVSLASKYGIVKTSIPVLPVGFNDPTYKSYKHRHFAQIDRSTTVILLTVERFIFGDLAAFSSDLSSSNNKFSVEHKMGSPDVTSLLADIKDWRHLRYKSENLSEDDNTAVLVPMGDVPGYIVIQIMETLQRSPQFANVILGGGII